MTVTAVSTTDAVTALGDAGIIAVIRTASADEAVTTAREVAKAGIRAVEVALTTPDAVSAIERLVDELPDEVVVGAGTALTSAQVADVQAAGGRFAMSPAIDEDVLQAGARRGLAVIPGALTPSEVATAIRAGATTIKIFPAATVGTAHLASLRQVFPRARFVPTGGIGLEDIRRWRTAGAFALGIGGQLDGARRRGGADAVRELAHRATLEWGHERHTDRREAGA